jgi:2'-5' RNA ligase
LALPELAAFTSRWRPTSHAPGQPPLTQERRFPPHITLLIPWLDPADPAAVADLRAVAQRHGPLELFFRQASTFDHGRVVWLVPEPAAALAALIDDVLQSFAQCPPYGGLHDEVIGHVTVSAEAEPGTLAQVCAALADQGPLRAQADQISIFARQSDEVWRQVNTVKLTGSRS